jgi:DNA (cytosine-5)-methyltransferase 1
MKAVDLFCGAGGSTTGAAQAGLDVVLAINHWRTAVFSHQDNHPNTRHLCARIDDIDPRHDSAVPDFQVLMASPECTHFSIARGGRPVDDQKRATPWHVCVWAEAKRPKWIIVENVREFTNWGPVSAKGKPLKSRKGETFRAWIKAIEAIGYTVDWRLLNAADFGAATKRIRLFVVARRGRGPVPFPGATHEGKWRGAHEIIDWTRICPSIFARKRPLAEKTIARIEAGLRKFVGGDAEPFIVKMRNNQTTGDVRDPLGTLTAGGGHQALAMPFIQRMQGPGSRDESYMGGHSANAPIPTLTTRPGFGVIAPFLAVYHNGEDSKRRTVGLDQPLPTIDTQPRFGLTAPYLIDVNHGGPRTAMDPRDPLGTITAKRGVAKITPFLTSYYGTGGPKSIDDPVGALTAKNRYGLALVKAMEDLGVVDIGFRMLDVDELAAAQGFPPGYQLRGTKAEQIRQVGNAVVPNVMRALCEAIQ